jgi:hypothetical protein
VQGVLDSVTNQERLKRDGGGTQVRRGDEGKYHEEVKTQEGQVGIIGTYLIVD